MWTSLRRSGDSRRGRPCVIGIALAVVACVGLAACTGAESPTPTPTSTADAVAPLPDTGPGDELDAGTYVVTGCTVPFEITVPEGWQSFGWGVLKENAGEWQVFVNFLSPTSVPTDGCAWRGTLVDTESPEAYVAAMAAQTSSQTSAPIEVTIGDYSGFEFDYAVENGVDFTTCDEERLCLFADSGANVCTRTHERAEERETQRVFDLNGELAMIAVGQFIDVDPALTAEARAVFDSIEFVSGG